MSQENLKADGLLLTTAVIWGFAFVAQRAGMAHVGPFAFNGVRFALGSLSLIPLLCLQKSATGQGSVFLGKDAALLLKGSAAAGAALFLGASLQQVGLVYTTAGKAGFITGLYVVMVPILGLFWRQQPESGTWMGAALAAIGLYLLSVTEDLAIQFGDLLELIGAFFWACHVWIIGWLSPRVNAIRLAFFQYAACSLLSLGAAALLEPISLSGLNAAAVPILYGGICSVGVAYTLQVVAQKRAHPAHAAILLSLEAVFAALGGWWLLGETMSARAMIGCALMLSGMLVSQLQSYWAASRRQYA